VDFVDGVTLALRDEFFALDFAFHGGAFIGG
jgi:hypothetical protein